MFKPAQKIPEQRPPERPSGASPRSAAPAGDGHQIHVRGIGVDGWDGTHEGKGDYENEAALQEIEADARVAPARLPTNRRLEAFVGGFTASTFFATRPT